MKKSLILLMSFSALALASCNNQAEIGSKTSSVKTTDSTTATSSTNEDTVSTSSINETSTTSTNTTTIDIPTSTVTTSTDTTVSTTIDIPTSTVTTSTDTTVSTTTEDETYYTISFYYYGDKTKKVGEQIVKEGDLASTLVAPSRIGYTFRAWSIYYNRERLLPDTYKFTQDISVYAMYDENTYNLTEVMQYTKELNESSLYGYDYIKSFNSDIASTFDAGGYVKGHICDFSLYENTPSYVKVSTPEELLKAIKDSKLDYSSDWVFDTDTYTEEQLANYNEYITLQEKVNNLTATKEEKTRRTELEAIVKTYSGHVEQTLNNEGSIHVIEITDDINMGYNLLSDTAKSYGVVSDFASNASSIEYSDTNLKGITMSSHFKENGVSQIAVEGINDLLIYSKNGAKLTNCGFKVTSCNDVVFRNLEMDEIWQWEDSPSDTPDYVVGDMDVFAWAYFKISFCGYVWIDHMTFGKSYDGQIDISNPYYFDRTTAFRMPYGMANVSPEDEYNGLHISNCCFNSGSDDKDGYLYKMMEEIEADYQLTLTDSTYETKYKYYKTLRDGFTYTSGGTSYDVNGLSFDEILYGIAIPQKKAFLCADSSDDYNYNLNLNVSFENDYFKNIEDRLPNVRGGFAYMYNSVIDNREYYQYRTILRGYGITNINKYNSKYKCGMVSQGIVGGYGASIRAEGCIFLGINELFKNNNSNSSYTDDEMAAGYSLINCLYSLTGEDTGTNLSLINTDLTPNTSDSQMSTANFSWHTKTGEAPFEINVYDPANLMENLFTYLHIGTNEYISDMYLYT